MISFYDYIKEINSFAGCKRALVEFCDKYDSCAVCLKAQLEKHDAEVRAEIIDALLDEIKAVIFDAIIEIENRAENLKE